MTSFYDEMKEKIESATEDFRDAIYEKLESIWRRCEDQDLKAELKELLERMI